jgi:diguanylate cyclase (GGDEF)-like protein
VDLLLDPAPARPVPLALPVRWSRWTLPVVLGVLAVAATALPPTRVPAMLGLSLLAVVAQLVGVARHRPERRRPWLAVAAMLASWTAGMTVVAVAPDARAAGGALIQVGAVVAAGLVVGLFLRQRHAPVVARRSATRWEVLGRRVDQLVVASVVALGAAQVLATGMATGLGQQSWAAVIAPLDLVLACLLLRFAASRELLPLPGRLAVGAALVTAVYDMLVTTGGVRIASPHSALSVLWAVAAVLFIAAPLHHRMADVYSTAILQSRRTESSRLLGLTPLALAPAGLYALGGTGAGTRLPTPVYLGVAALVTVLVIARGAQTVLGSERRAQQDPLTGVANRRGLAAAFDQVLAARPATPASPQRLLARLCLLDVDDFKQVNDTFGHEAGDRLLRAISERLLAVIGPAGTVARSGGDEFILLLDPDGPHPERVLAAVFEPPFDLGSAAPPRRVRASAGWTAVTTGSELAHALADADVALYATKRTGKDGVTAFAPSLRADVLGRLALVDDLRQLLAGTGGGRLEVRYQPLVSLADDVVVGCEALVRWQHPERGLLMPDSFLGLAEEHGLGAQIDAEVLAEAVAQLTRWDAAGLPRLFVSVNLGRSSMLDPLLATGVQAALRSAGLPADRLHLEITEHAELPPTAGAEALRTLAGSGVRVSLDDFGVGYTSLDYLRRYPVTTLKLDRSITEPLQRDSTSALLSGVVLLAGSLGIEVLAEGIETEVQKQRLTALGARTGQGYLLARPLPADDLADMVRPRHPALSH